MKTKFRINVTFFQYLTFHKEDKEKESKRIGKGLAREYRQFKKIIEKKITKKQFGPLKGIAIYIGDDDDLYPDCTQVEYWFGFDHTCAKGDDEIIEEYDGIGVLQLNEDVENRIKEAAEKILRKDYFPELIISAVELHEFKKPNIVIYKPPVDS